MNFTSAVRTVASGGGGVVVGEWSVVGGDSAGERLGGGLFLLVQDLLVNLDHAGEFFFAQEFPDRFGLGRRLPSLKGIGALAVAAPAALRAQHELEGPRLLLDDGGAEQRLSVVDHRVADVFDEFAQRRPARDEVDDLLARDAEQLSRIGQIARDAGDGGMDGGFGEWFHDGPPFRISDCGFRISELTTDFTDNTDKTR